MCKWQDSNSTGVTCELLSSCIFFINTGQKEPDFLRNQVLFLFLTEIAATFFSFFLTDIGKVGKVE